MRPQTKILPQEFYVAVSGGADSIALAYYLGYHYKHLPMTQRRLKGLIYVNHRTQFGALCQPFVQDFADSLNTTCHVFQLEDIEDKPKELSLESWWHHQRKQYFNDLDHPIVTAHHLDDAVETWYMGNMFGDKRFLTWVSGRVYRPLLLTKKTQIYEYCKRENINWLEDPSNQETHYLRNGIRHMLSNSTKAIQDLSYARVKAILKEQL